MGEKGEVRKRERERSKGVREARENRNSSVANLKEKNNFSHFARRVERAKKMGSGKKKRDKKQIAGRTHGARLCNLCCILCP